MSAIYAGFTIVAALSGTPPPSLVVPPALLGSAKTTDDPVESSGSGQYSSIADGDSVGGTSRHDTIGAMHAEIVKIAALGEDWDEEGAPAPHPQAITHAFEWINRLCQVAPTGPTAHPYISPTAHGDVVFEFWNDPKKLTIYARPEGLDYLKSWGPDIFTDMEDGEVEDVRSLWEWLNGG